MVEVQALRSRSHSALVPTPKTCVRHGQITNTRSCRLLSQAIISSFVFSVALPLIIIYIYF